VLQKIPACGNAYDHDGSGNSSPGTKFGEHFVMAQTVELPSSKPIHLFHLRLFPRLGLDILDAEVVLPQLTDG
jgi:hypothetical protein